LDTGRICARSADILRRLSQRLLAESRPVDESQPEAISRIFPEGDAGSEASEYGYRAQRLITARVNSGQRNVAVW
jgi:hypothetical protein